MFVLRFKLLVTSKCYYDIPVIQINMLELEWRKWNFNSDQLDILHTYFNVLVTIVTMHLKGSV